MYKRQLQRALNIERETLDESQEDFLKQAVDDILDSYRLKSRKSNRDKIHYYIERDLIGYGKIDTMMQDPTLRMSLVTDLALKFLFITDVLNR